jgi:ketosteroid isomerase-like protein
LNCPYCQTNIKDNADKIICSSCHSPHHKECWEENNGCTTYGCENNPNTKSKPVDVGNKTVENIQRMLVQEVQDVKTFECPNCKKQIEEGSLFCKYCGAGTDKKNVDREKFEEEFQRRYQIALKSKRRRFLITLTSISILTLLLFMSVYFAFTKYVNYYNSEERKIKSLLRDWESSWEAKDINKYKELMDKDYIYYDKDGKAIKLDEKIKRMQWTFDNYKKIKLQISNINISIDSTTANYANVSFKQVYTSDKKEEKGTKTLRLFKGEENGYQWKIFREYFEQ